MTRRVLVVDDEVGICLVLQDALELEGYEVQVCQDAATAREKLAEDHFDAALVDVFLSDQPAGVEFAKHVQSVSPHTRVVLMTGYAEEADIKDGYLSGVYACIRKPFVLDDVVRVVGTALDQAA